ncbi:MAG: hypothetical protein K6A65_04785, partial [Succinivibrionaceae bacterium]|nr:hypothetical protein [Succinivibrionaceae bacterium]
MSLDTILMLTSALLLGVLMVVFYLAWRQQSHAQRSELPGQASISRSKEVMLILGFIANSCAFRGQAHKAVLRRIVDSSVAQSGVGSAAEQRARQALNLAFIRGFLEYKTQESIVPELHKLRDSNLSEQGRARDLTCTRMLDLILCEGQLSQEAKLRYLLV